MGTLDRLKRKREEVELRLKKEFMSFLGQPITEDTKGNIEYIAKNYENEINLYLSTLGITEPIVSVITWSMNNCNINFVPRDEQAFMQQLEMYKILEGGKE